MLLARAGLDVVVVDRAPGRQRHAVHPHADAWRRHPAAPMGPARRHPCGRHPGRAAHRLPPRRRRDRRGHPAGTRHRRPVRARAAPCSTRCWSTPRNGRRHGPLRFHRPRAPAGPGSHRGWSAWFRPMGGPSAIRARYVVGADGFNSVVAQTSWPRSTRSAGMRGSYQYRYWDGVETDGYHWVFRPRATAGACPPTTDSRACSSAPTPDRISSRRPEIYAACSPRRHRTSPSASCPGGR